MIVFLDTEFTDLLDPQLLSIGMVSLAGQEHYVELDLMTDEGLLRERACGEFAREVVLELWGLVEGATGTWWEMGRRTADWLVQLAAESGGCVKVAYDYSTDYILLEDCIRNAGDWERVREVVRPVNVSGLTGSPDAELAAEACLCDLRRRGLRAHHALADAVALRAAYQAIKARALGSG